MSFVPNVIAREPHFPEYRRAPVLSESHIEATGLRFDIRARFTAVKIESRLEDIGLASCSSPVVGYLVVTPQIVGFLLEVGDLFSITNIPKRADHGHEGSFAGAVLAHEEGERRQTGGLFLSESSGNS